MRGPAPKAVRKPRIAFVFNHHFFLGGGERSCSELILNLDRDIYDPIALVPEEGDIKEYLSNNEINTFVTPLAPLRGIPCGRPLFSLLRFMKVIKRNRVNIIHANGSRACFYSVLAGRLLGIPILWHVRETITDFFLYDGFMVLLADIIICVSKGVQNKRFERFGPTIRSKTRVVYNGVDTRTFKGNEDKRELIRKGFGLEECDVLFGIVGNLISIKGQDFFLRALAKAKKERPALEARVLLVGRPLDPRFHKGLRKLVSGMGLNGDVIFHDYTEDITDIFSALDVFALPSKREGFSRSLLEAMSYGLPVLATRLDETKEAVIDGEGAIFADYNDVEKMGAALIRLSEKSSLRRAMGTANRKRAEDRYDIERHAESLQEIYSELLSGDL